MLPKANLLSQTGIGFLCYFLLQSHVSSEMAEAKQTLNEIRDFDGDAAEASVKFVYSSRLTLTVDHVQPLLYAACILQDELVARALL